MNFIKKVLKNWRDERRSKHKVLLSRSRGGNVAMAVFLSGFCLFMVLPMVYSIVQSLKPIEEIFAYPPRFFVKHPTLSNFKEVFKLADNLWVPFSRYVFNSLFVAIVGTSFYMIVAALAAYPLAKGKFKGLGVISQLIVLAMLFRPEVIGVPQYIIISGLGMVDTYYALILPVMSGTMGVFLLKQFIISAVPDATLEAAQIDGAGEYRMLFSIVLPSIKPAMLTLLIFTFQSMWAGSGTQYIFSEELKLLPSVLSSIAAGGIARTGAASAVTVLLMIPPIAVFLYSQSSVMETMSHSGLK